MASELDVLLEQEVVARVAVNASVPRDIELGEEDKGEPTDLGEE
jgi:hypothetical protein